MGRDATLLLDVGNGFVAREEMKEHFRTFVIGIGGGTGSGKTTLARSLVNHFSGGCVFDLDSYYLDRSQTEFQDRDYLNYDEPSAFDIRLLLDHLRRAQAGEMVWKPRYSFENHTRTGAEKLYPSTLIIVEGLLLLLGKSYGLDCT
ncbi:MAG: hypothetical protein M5R38_05750 [Candidatus Methylomirabilis sp.]|nr:hypothetical protein [Candidatus Methylomirabilis sp.]